jgi:hypothetical protein
MVENPLEPLTIVLGACLGGVLYHAVSADWTPPPEAAIPLFRSIPIAAGSFLTGFFATGFAMPRAQELPLTTIIGNEARDRSRCSRLWIRSLRHGEASRSRQTIHMAQLALKKENGNGEE